MFLQNLFSRFAAKTTQPVVKDAKQDRWDRMTGRTRPAAPKRDKRSFGTAAHEQLKTSSDFTPRPLRGLA